MHKIKFHILMGSLKVDMPILKCIFFTFNWLTLTSKMHFVNSELCALWGSFLFTLQRQKKVCTPGDEAIMKINKKLLSGIPINFTFLLYLQKYKEFEAEILDLQLEKYGLSFNIRKCTTFGWALGDENVIGIRSFKIRQNGSRRIEIC